MEELQRCCYDINLYRRCYCTKDPIDIVVMRDAHRAHYAYTNDETIEGHVRKQRQKMQDASARYIQLPGIKPRLSTSIDQPVEFYLLSSELSPVLIRSISPIIRFQTEVRVGDTFQCARKKQNKQHVLRHSVDFGIKASPSFLFKKI